VTRTSYIQCLDALCSLRMTLFETIVLTGTFLSENLGAIHLISSYFVSMGQDQRAQESG